MGLEDVGAGDTASVDYTITKEMTVNRTGADGADVLSTPWLLNLMELTCIEATDGKLAPDMASVGYAVDGLRHLAPTAIGATVTVTAKLTALDGKKFTYDIEAVEDGKTIGVANHRRAAIRTG
jgi:fluoroacetyl-CoA thioesterase